MVQSDEAQYVTILLSTQGVAVPYRPNYYLENPYSRSVQGSNPALLLPSTGVTSSFEYIPGVTNNLL